MAAASWRSNNPSRPRGARNSPTSSRSRVRLPIRFPERSGKRWQPATRWLPTKVFSSGSPGKHGGGNLIRPRSAGFRQILPRRSVSRYQFFSALGDTGSRRFTSLANLRGLIREPPAPQLFLLAINLGASLAQFGFVFPDLPLGILQAFLGRTPRTRGQRIALFEDP